MEKINAFEQTGDSEEIKYGDFNNETVYTEDATSNEASLEEKIIRHRKKSDLTTALITTGINALPIVTDVFKHRKDPTPYRVNKNDLLCFGLASALPVFQAVDTFAFGGKCQDTINKKLNGNLTFNDIRNLVNLVNLYAPAHDLIKKTMDQASAKANGVQAVPIDGFTKARAAIGFTTLVAPFVSDKLSDDSKSIAARVGSILPIPFIGSIVRSVISKSNNTKLQGMYQIANTTLSVVGNANRSLTPAVRATTFGNGNAVNKVSSELDSAINFASQILGTPRGNIGNSMYGNSYNSGWGNMNF